MDEERAKRMKGSPPPRSPGSKTSDRRNRSRERDRRYDGRRSRDPRDEFDESPRYDRRDRDGRRDRQRGSIEEENYGRRQDKRNSPPPLPIK